MNRQPELNVTVKEHANGHAKGVDGDNTKDLAHTHRLSEDPSKTKAMKEENGLRHRH